MLALTIALLLAAPPAFHAEVSGKGRPMILIPGLSSSGAVWDGVALHEKATHECHVLTLAGFAGQPPIAGPLIATARRELAAYIRRHKLEKPVIVGHSLGGFLALSLAAEEPGLVGPVVVVDALPYFPAVQMPGATAEGAKPYAAQIKASLMAQTPEQRAAQLRATLATMITDPKQVERAARWGDASDPRTVADAVAEMMLTDLRPEVPRIKARTLILGSWIALKGVVPEEQVEAAYRAQYAGLAGHRLIMHPTARHFIMLDDQAGFLAELDKFLK